MSVVFLRRTPSKENTRREDDSERTQLRDGKHDYEVALSFAGENRNYVESVAKYLTKHGVVVFYDKFEEVELWGKDLVERLGEVYGEKSRYCVMFISKYYDRKPWAILERKSAFARALMHKKEYILPVRLDGTEVSGILSTMAFVDATNKNPDELGEMIVKKLAIPTIGHDERGETKKGIGEGAVVEESKVNAVHRQLARILSKFISRWENYERITERKRWTPLGFTEAFGEILIEANSCSEKLFDALTANDGLIEAGLVGQSYVVFDCLKRLSRSRITSRGRSDYTHMEKRGSMARDTARALLSCLKQTKIF